MRLQTAHRGGHQVQIVGAVDDEAHMIWGCPALIDQRVQHSELFEDSTITSVSGFLQQDAGQLAPFLRFCHDHCAELEGYGSSRV